MKKFVSLCFLPFLLSGCVQSTECGPFYRYFGVFLGASGKDTNKLVNYDNLIVDLDEFDSSQIKSLKENNNNVYAYLSVGSLEKYRSYYDTYKDLTFMDYDNWPDERWVDVSSSDWQTHIINEANRLFDLGADGLFIDNFDVYYIALEEYECSDEFKENIYQGCVDILSDLSKTNLNIIVNSGTDFLERLHEENSKLLKSIDIYAQECVFSSIIDYENDEFGVQDKETQDYYLSIASFMKENSKVLFIEYSIDQTLIETIEKYCRSNSIYYYISSTVNLISK